MAAIKSRLKRLAEGDGPREDTGRVPVLSALAGITAAFVLGSGIFIFTMLRINNPFERVEDVTVPSLVGMKYETVRTSENFSDYIIEVDGIAEYSEEHEKGTIFEQKPNAGRLVKPGSKILVRVSAGAEIIQLPDYIGQEATLVFSQIRALGLDYTQVDVFSNTVPEGFVVATEPGRGSELSPGEVVRVLVSMGEDTKVIMVPDLGGKSLEEARSELVAAGLNVGTIEYRDDASRSGTVIGQNPAPSSQVSSGGYVNLTVSSGDEVINQVTLYVRLSDNLPNVINISATQDGDIVVAPQQVQPSLVRVWKPTFVGNGTSQVRIYVDGKLYMEYGVDFDNATSTLLNDYSGDFN